jgi:hypothetical protein
MLRMASWCAVVARSQWLESLLVSRWRISSTHPRAIDAATSNRNSNSATVPAVEKLCICGRRVEGRRCSDVVTHSYSLRILAASSFLICFHSSFTHMTFVPLLSLWCIDSPSLSSLPLSSSFICLYFSFSPHSLLQRIFAPPLLSFPFLSSSLLSSSVFDGCHSGS